MMFNGSPGCFWDPRAVITDSNRSTKPQDIGEERRFRPVWLKFTPGLSLPIPIFSLKVYERFLSYQVPQEFWWHVSLQKKDCLQSISLTRCIPFVTLLLIGKARRILQFRHKGKGVKFGSKVPSFQQSFVANPSLDQWLPRCAPTSFFKSSYNPRSRVISCYIPTYQFIRPFIGVITLLKNSRGPPCIMVGNRWIEILTNLKFRRKQKSLDLAVKQVVKFGTDDDEEEHENAEDDHEYEWRWV